MAAAKAVVEASDVVEDVREIVEDTVELAEDGSRWIVSNPKVLVFSAILAGAVVGSAATYMVVSKRIAAKWQRLADEQIEDVKNHYALLNKEGENGDLAALAATYRDEETIEAVEEIIESEGYLPYDKVSTEAVSEEAKPEDIQQNIFESDDPTRYFNFEEELKRREEFPDRPFVITKDEVGETDYDTIELTYYDGDDTLADDKDKPVGNIEKLVGSENLLRFGHGSGDPQIVYIRNPDLKVDIEVTANPGKFAKVILGFESELRHADRRPQRRFRPSDE